MGADHGLSERAYAALKLDLVEGELPPGRVRIPHLVERYQAGATPVREAMLRLVGEGLLIMPVQGGFEVSALDEITVRHLYEIAQCTILDAAACQIGASSTLVFDEEDETDRMPAIERLFEFLALRTGNPFFLARVRGLNDQMRRIRRAEEARLSGLHREFAALLGQIRRDERPSVRRSLIAYHKRRLRHLPEIVGAIPPARRT